MIIILLFVIGVGLFVFKTCFSGELNESDVIKLNDICSFDEENQILTIKCRSPLLSKVVTIEDKYDIVVEHVPEKLHVGAVSVGGVTSGGTFKTGGYNNIASQTKNGLCTLKYKKVHQIRRIKLNNQIYKEACKDDRVHPYLIPKYNAISVVNEIELSEFERMEAMCRYMTSGYIGNKAANAGYPTKEKAKKILDWITEEECIKTEEKVDASNFSFNDY